MNWFYVLSGCGKIILSPWYQQFFKRNNFFTLITHTLITSSKKNQLQLQLRLFTGNISRNCSDLFNTSENCESNDWIIGDKVCIVVHTADNWTECLWIPLFTSTKVIDERSRETAIVNRSRPKFCTSPRGTLRIYPWMPRMWFRSFTGDF